MAKERFRTINILRVNLCQIPIGVFFAALFKWNKLSAAIGVWITNPVTAPFIYGSTYYLGAHILGIDTSFSAESMFSVSFVTEFIKNTPLIFATLMMGGIIVGVPLAVISYFGSYALLQRYQERVKQALEKQKTKLQIRGAQILSDNLYLAYHEEAKDAAQQRIWTFYEAVKQKHKKEPYKDALKTDGKAVSQEQS